MMELKSKKILNWFEDNRLTYENQAKYLSRLYKFQQNLVEIEKKDLLLNDDSKNSIKNLRDFKSTSFKTVSSSLGNLSSSNYSLFRNQEKLSINTDNESELMLPDIISKKLVIKLPHHKSEYDLVNKKDSLPFVKHQQQQHLNKQSFIDVIDGKKLFELSSTNDHDSQNKQNLDLNKKKIANVKQQPVNVYSINRIKKLLNLDTKSNRVPEKQDKQTSPRNKNDPRTRIYFRSSLSHINRENTKLNKPFIINTMTPDLQKETKPKKSFNFRKITTTDKHPKTEYRYSYLREKSAFENYAQLHTVNKSDNIDSNKATTTTSINQSCSDCPICQVLKDSPRLLDAPHADLPLLTIFSRGYNYSNTIQQKNQNKSSDYYERIELDGTYVTPAPSPEIF